MTEHFEVVGRDGAARLGRLRLAEPVTTPALLDDVLEDAGSLWAAERELPDGVEDALTVLPHRGFPGGTREAVREAFAVEYPEVSFPSAAVIHSEAARNCGTDAYLLSDVQSLVGHGRAVRDAVVRVRAAIPPDTALVCSGVATPRNVAALAYAGVDGFDDARAVVAGTEGRYLTTEGAYDLETVRELDELPCRCSTCTALAEDPDALTREDCVAHNRTALRAELARVRQRIRAGRLRDYLEGQARHANWCVALLRELDEGWGYLEERTPILREADLDAASEDTLRRVEIRRFADRVTTRYRNRFDNPLVLLPCSARKPYSDSQSHRQFYRAIEYRGHVVSMTSPIGVVPTELECTYPAQHYDSVVTGRWSAEEVEFVSTVLARYLERNDYPAVIAHVPDEGYREVVERAVDAADLSPADVPVTYTVEADQHPRDPDALATLDEALDPYLKFSKREREHNTVRAIADYLIGDGAGDELFADIRTTSRHPKLQVRDTEDTQLAAQVARYGTLSFTLEGARRWVEADVPTRRVTIEDFVPHGSVLAPGVTDADASIRVGDEVVIEGPAAFGVGRAAMFGREMVESNRGVAVEVRHVEEH